MNITLEDIDDLVETFAAIGIGLLLVLTMPIWIVPYMIHRLRRR
jgi:hypothetical protein